MRHDLLGYPEAYSSRSFRPLYLQNVLRRANILLPLVDTDCLEPETVAWIAKDPLDPCHSLLLLLFSVKNLTMHIEALRCNTGHLISTWQQFNAQRPHDATLCHGCPRLHRPTQMRTMFGRRSVLVSNGFYHSFSFQHRTKTPSNEPNSC